jgi:hypothetical protein
VHQGKHHTEWEWDSSKASYDSHNFGADTVLLLIVLLGAAVVDCTVFGAGASIDPSDKSVTAGQRSTSPMWRTGLERGQVNVASDAVLCVHGYST